MDRGMGAALYGRSFLFLRFGMPRGIDSVSISHRHSHAHVSATTDIYSHVIKEAEKRISDCAADVILKPAKAKLRVVGD